MSEQIIVAVKEGAEEGLQYTVSGWEITTMPPHIKEVGNINLDSYPALPVHAETSTCNKVSSTITPNTPHNTWEGPMNNSGGENGALTIINSGNLDAYWDFNSMDEVICLNTVNGITENVTLEAEYATRVVAGNAPSNSNVWVNTVLFINEKNEDNGPNYHPVKWDIPSRMLRGSGATQNLKVQITGAGAWIKSFKLKSKDLQLTASYYWKAVASDTITPNITNIVTATSTKGNTSSTADTNTFAETVGVKVEGSVSDVLSKVSVSLSTSFTATQSNTHTVSVTEKESDGISKTINVEKGKSKLSYIIWQLVIVYEADGTKIEQAIPLEKVSVTRTLSE